MTYSRDSVGRRGEGAILGKGVPFEIEKERGGLGEGGSISMAHASIPRKP